MSIQERKKNMLNNTFEKSRRRLTKCRLINALMWTENLNSAMRLDMRCLMVKIGGMSSLIQMETSNTEDNSGKYFCLQNICRQFKQGLIFYPTDVYYKKKEIE